MSIILRFARTLVAQLIALALAEWGGIGIPIINMSLAALVTALFKWLRDTFPKNPILEWLPI